MSNNKQMIDEFSEFAAQLKDDGGFEEDYLPDEEFIFKIFCLTYAWTRAKVESEIAEKSKAKRTKQVVC